MSGESSPAARSAQNSGAHPAQKGAAIPSIHLETPVGRLTLVEADGALARIGWRLGADGVTTPLLAEVARQMAAYFAVDLKHFDLPLAPAATAAAQAARDAMIAIPYGRTATYGALAAATGSHAREVGQQCGANPFAIVVPCHRVLPAQGFGQYSGGEGPRTKSWLLAHEGAALL